MFLTFANLRKSELEVAVRAQALYTVIRTQAWKPKAGDIISNGLLRLNGVESETKGTYYIQCQLYTVTCLRSNI